MAQIAVVRRGGVHERLRGGDAMLLQHHHEHLGVHDRAGVKQFHAKIYVSAQTKFEITIGNARMKITVEPPASP